MTAILPALLIPERLPGRVSWSKCQGNGTEYDHTRYRQTTTAALTRSQLISYGWKPRQPRPTASEPRPQAAQKECGNLTNTRQREDHCLTDLVVQLQTSKMYLQPAQKETMLSIKCKDSKTGCQTQPKHKEFLQSNYSAIKSHIISLVFRFTDYINYKCTVLLTWNASK